MSEVSEVSEVLQDTERHRDISRVREAQSGNIVVLVLAQISLGGTALLRAVMQ